MNPTTASQVNRRLSNRAGIEVRPVESETLSKRLLKRLRIWLLLFVCPVFLLMSACSSDSKNSATPTSAPSVYDVDPVFREFYDVLGGEERLGYPISGIFDEGGPRCQYTLNVKMCYDPALTGVDRYYLSALGAHMGVGDPADPLAPPDAQATIDGYTIYQDFLPVYDNMYGQRFAGRPLSQLRYNRERQRFEQYFENVVFALDFDAPAEAAYLLPLGHHFYREGGGKIQEPP